MLVLDGTKLGPEIVELGLVALTEGILKIGFVSINVYWSRGYAHLAISS